MKDRPFLFFAVVVLLSLVISGIRPASYGVWLFELSLGFAAFLALVFTHRRFRFSPLVYGLASLHFIVLAVGAHYTYAEVPLFNWLRDALHLSRNHFDRVGHFMQGFVPALAAREVLLRKTALKKGFLLSLLVVSVCLAFSALYEILEWIIAANFYPTSGLEWLGIQGDIWDTQKDMFFALFGAVVAVLGFSRIHDQSMRNKK